ncbi:MAG TPA: hypothetical protein VGZ32_02875 [Actinocrinis sp.]|uniref:glycan biosynthesis hexose transferase WsfD n=1 Tax=Actinocrinis sp. TaxID=1920516 RepID=UPI002DDCEBB8|nr:hypothetical protein [Actinocrinis sp.]HEV3169249.1 hypothetical protein [Actinocrinis sp.]
MNRLLTSEGWEDAFGVRVPVDPVAAASRAALAWVRAHPAISTGAVWGLITLARLFAGGAVGMADNFDGHRLLCQLGVAPRPIPAGQPLWAFVTPTYDAYTWYGEACSAGGTGQPYLSTEYFPLLLAKLLTQLFGLSGALDLRMLGPIFAAGIAVAVGWTVRELPGPRWAAVLAASGIGLAAVDSAIAPYYISPFSEPAALLGLLLLIPATLRLLSRERVRARDIALVAVIAAWTIGAKTQMASILIAVVPVLLLRPWARVVWAQTDRGRRRAVKRLLRAMGAVATRLPALAACAVLVGGTALFEQHQSRWLNEIVLYDDVFRDVLGHSSHVHADLRALGLPTDLASAAGSSIVAPNSAAKLPDYPRFVQQESFGRVLAFYITHPWRLPGVADRGLVGMAATRPSYLGNYLASSGAAPYARECRVCVAPALFTLSQPLRWVVIPGLWAVALAGGIWLAGKRRAVPPRARGVGAVLAGIAAATVAQFWTVMLSEGDSDIEKHMVFALFGTMLLGPLMVAAVAALDQRLAAQPEPAPERSAL